MNGELPELVVQVRLVSAHERKPSFARVAAALAIVAMAVIALPSSCGVIFALVSLFTDPSAGSFLAAATALGLFAALTYGAWKPYRYLSTKHLVVGTDGICVSPSGLFYDEWFCPFDRVNRVEVDRRGVRLVLEARSILLATSSAPISVDRFLRSNRVDERDAVFALIHDAHQHASASHDTHAKLELLDRAGRSIVAWRDAIVRLAKDQGGYREARFEPEDLTRVAEDASASPERRAAAAIAVRAIGDETLAWRVRIASDACADSELRRALLEAVAEGELLETEISGATKRRG